MDFAIEYHFNNFHVFSLRFNLVLNIISWPFYNQNNFAALSATLPTRRIVVMATNGTFKSGTFPADNFTADNFTGRRLRGCR